MSFQSLARPGLHRALALSLVAHLLLLWPSPPGWQARERPAPLTATLRPTGQVGIAGQRVPIRTGDTAPSPQQHQESAPGSGVPTPTPNWTVADGTRSGDRPEPVQTEGVVDAEGLRGYRLALAREASRHKIYPQQAIDAGWRGTVQVQVTMPAEGLPQHALLGSSGFPLLDGAAEEMLRHALPATALPESLRGKRFSVILPIVFELPD